MSDFIDYYVLLGLKADASQSEIKAAFKKLALQYHPDVYKGDDAKERMHLLLQAYKTLNDPTMRKQFDAQRSEHFTDSVAPRVASDARSAATSSSASSHASSRARRDRQRQYAFPDIVVDQSALVDLGDIEYKLDISDAQELRRRGMMRGVATRGKGQMYYCHRCHHRWREQSRIGNAPLYCPKCAASDWPEFLLLRCIHCSAVFESEQIRYEVGAYSYAQGSSTAKTGLCPPYELFPLCPYCGTAHWCPAEEARVDELRREATNRTLTLLCLWLGVAMIALILLSFVVAGVFR